LVKDINDTKYKLEKGLNALDFLDTNINIMSNWLTEVEQKLDEFKNTQLSEKNAEVTMKFIKVRFIIIFIFKMYNVYLYLLIEDIG